MPDFHKLNKTKTTEMSKEELNRRLREEINRSAAKPAQKKRKPENQKRQQKISEQTKRQMPPQSPVRRKREEELRQREKEEKKRKRRRHGNYVVYYVLIGLFVAIVFAILSVTVLFNTEQIIVEGESIYSDEEIIAASGLKGNENLVRFSTSGISEKITDALVSLDSAEVTKQFPNAIKITVKAAEPMVNFYYAGKNYVISHVGRVMQIDKNAADCMEVIGYQPGENVVVGDYITAANPEQDDMISEISAVLDKLGITEITELDISDTLSITMTYEDRIKIKLGTIYQLEQKLSMVKELIDKYIDDGARVSLDVTNTDKVIQRPLTSVQTRPPETTPPETEETGEQTSENAEEVPQ